MRPPPEARWRCQADDGIGHAFLTSRGITGSICRRVTAGPERFDRPIQARCPECLDGLNELTKKALMAPTTPTRGAW